jgi:hypothetical protein
MLKPVVGSFRVKLLRYNGSSTLIVSRRLMHAASCNTTSRRYATRTRCVTWPFSAQTTELAAASRHVGGKSLHTSPARRMVDVAKPTGKTERPVSKLSRITGYTFSDPAYADLVLSDRPDVAKGRQHLAIIGDALLKLIYYTANFPLPAGTSHHFRAFAPGPH